MMVFLLVCMAARADDFPKGTFTIKVGEDKWSIKYQDKEKFLLYRNGQETCGGTYRVAKDEVEIKLDKGAFDDKNAEKVGKYKWKLDDKKLSFTKVEDEFEGRVKVLTSGPWVME